MRNKITWNLLFNPFSKIAGWQAFALGLVFVLITGLLGAYANIAYDGVIDVHLTESLTVKDSFVILAIDIVSAVGVFFIAGLVISRHVRFVDILGTMILARAPLIILSMIGLFIEPLSLSVDEILDNPMALFRNTGIILFSVICIPILIWFITLMFNAFKVSSGAKGAKLIMAFIIGLIIAEIISKILIFQII